MKPITAFMLLLWVIARAKAQESSPPPALRAESIVVLVPALVRDAGGKPVFTLTAHDFRVTDDGVEQALTLDADTGGEPLALVVAIETGGAGALKLDAYRDLGGALSALVGSIPHLISVVGFDSTPSVLVPFTGSIDSAAAALHDLEPGDKGAAIFDALAFSIYQLRTAPAGYRRAILLISETLDDGSQARLEDALREISDTNTAIYALAFSSVKAHAGRAAAKIMHDGTPGPAHGCFAGGSKRRKG